MLFSLENRHLIWIIISCIVSGIILIALIVFFVLKSTNKNKYLTRVDNMLKEINVENKAQIDAYVLRLKNIATKNDSYTEIFNQISAQFERLMTTERDKLLLRQKGLKERINNEKKIKKGLLDQIRSFENAVNQYKKEIKHIQTDLESYFKEGDDLRIQLTNLQSQYQQILSDIEKYTPSLSICKNELMDYLADIEMYFDIFDGNISAAKYKEAKKNIEDIESHILNVYGHVETIAQYCKMVDEIIPQQLVDLMNKNDELANQGYVVSHARVNEFVENANQILESCKNEFKHLRFGDFDEVSYEIQSKFSEIHAHLDQEVMSKQELDEKYKVVSEKIEKAESEFIKTKRQFSVMLEYYKLSEDIHEKFSIFQQDATLLSDLKVEYQGYLFVKAKHPASFMLEKLGKLDEICDRVLDNIHFFTSYFNKMKEYVEVTYKKANDLLIQITKSLGEIRYYKCKPVYIKYIDTATSIMNSLKHVKDLLMKKPIDISILYSSFSSLVSNADDLILSLHNDLENYQTVEKCIVFANPLRYQFVEVNQALNQIEELFKNGDYIQAQDKLNYILNNYHPAAYDSFKR